MAELVMQLCSDAASVSALWGLKLSIYLPSKRNPVVLVFRRVQRTISRLDTIVAKYAALRATHLE